jgi:hypothetical protein
MYQFLIVFQCESYLPPNKGGHSLHDFKNVKEFISFNGFFWIITNSYQFFEWQYSIQQMVHPYYNSNFKMLDYDLKL